MKATPLLDVQIDPAARAEKIPRLAFEVETSSEAHGLDMPNGCDATIPRASGRPREAERGFFLRRGRAMDEDCKRERSE